METKDMKTVNLILRQYKYDGGGINFPAVLKIPSSERIPVLAKQDFNRINMLIIGALTVAIENLNVKRRLNEIQILDLAETIIDSSNEDNLSFEDLMLFLQKLTRGEYKLATEMDIPKFMETFEIFREERHQQYHAVVLETHIQHKSMGDGSRSTQSDPLSEHFSKMGERLSVMKDRISELKQENSSLKMDNL